MDPSFRIRPATPADSICIAVLGMQVFLDTYATKGVWPSLAREATGDFSAATIERQMGQPGAFFLVAEEGDCAFYERQGYDDVGPSTYSFEDELYETRRFLKRLA